MHCSIIAGFLFVSILFNSGLYCSQTKLKEIPETRMVVWRQPVVDVIREQVQKPKQVAPQNNFKLSVPPNYLVNDAHSKQEAEKRVVVNSKVLRNHFSPNGLEMGMVERAPDMPIARFFQNDRPAIDARYFTEMLHRLEAFEEPKVSGTVNLRPLRLKDNHYSDANKQLLLLTANVCLAAKRQKSLRNLELQLKQGDMALPSIAALFDEGNLSYNSKVDGKWTGLHIACSRGYYELAEFFVQRNANVNICGPQKMTPLMCAVETDRVHIIELLVKDRSLKIDKQDEQGETALIKAINKGSMQAVNLISCAGASVLIADNAGKTPLMLAEMHLKKLKDATKKCSIKEIDKSDADSDEEDERVQNTELIAVYEGIIPYLRIREKAQREAFEKSEAQNKEAKDGGFEIVPDKTIHTRSSNNAAPLCDYPEGRSEGWKYWLMWHVRQLVNEVMG